MVYDNTRYLKDYKAGHIKGALLHIPLAEFRRRYAELDKSTTLVALTKETFIKTHRRTLVFIVPKMAAEVQRVSLLRELQSIVEEFQNMQNTFRAELGCVHLRPDYSEAKTELIRIRSELDKLALECD